MQKTIKELEDIKRRVEDLLITLKQSNQSKTKQDDKPSFVKNLWSRNPQKVNGKYPSIMSNFKEDMINDLAEEQQEMGGEW
tara:strand:- start:247 stop:489 length:243 start_codon:yes stop_codon:yes gene_type:complete